MNECPICYEPISSDVNKVVTECGHAFHCKCLMMNASINGFSCPCCRSEMAKKKVKTNRSRIQEPSPDMQVDTNMLQRGYRVSTRMNVVEEYEDDDEEDEDEEDEDDEDYDNLVENFDDVVAVGGSLDRLNGVPVTNRFYHEMQMIFRNECWADVPNIFTSFRMFMQRVEGEEVEEEGYFQAEEREGRVVEEAYIKRKFGMILNAVNKRGITKEDLVETLIQEWIAPDYKKTHGKVKGAFFAAKTNLDQQEYQNQQR